MQKVEEIEMVQLSALLYFLLLGNCWVLIFFPITQRQKQQVLSGDEELEVKGSRANAITQSGHLCELEFNSCNTRASEACPTCGAT